MPDPNEMSQNGSPTLRVYVSWHCPLCREALRIVEDIQRKFTGLHVQVVDIEDERTERFDSVFSIPTYVLDGRTLSLGNPDRELLDRELRQAVCRTQKKKE